MTATEQTIQQVERVIRKIAQKFPETEENACLTDIHLRVSPDSGELVAFDDNELEITRSVVEQWIEYKGENFYEGCTSVLRKVLMDLQEVVDHLGIMKPYSFVLEDEDKESLAELYLADDNTIIIGGDLMEGLDKDLDSFFEELLKEKD